MSESQDRAATRCAGTSKPNPVWPTHAGRESQMTVIENGDCGSEAARDVYKERESNREERAMKMTAALVERTLSQFEAEAIPDDHPVVPELSKLFGVHTFFLDRNGLN